MFERIDTIIMPVTEIEKAIQWYEENLNMRVSYQGEGYCVLSVGQGETPLTLEQADGSSTQGATRPILFAKNIHGVHQKLREKGVSVSDIQTEEANTFFHFVDLDGNQLEVCYWE